jgi:hypothetical protein
MTYVLVVYWRTNSSLLYGWIKDVSCMSDHDKIIKLRYLTQMSCLSTGYWEKASHPELNTLIVLACTTSFQGSKTKLPLGRILLVNIVRISTRTLEFLELVATFQTPEFWRPAHGECAVWHRVTHLLPSSSYMPMCRDVAMWIHRGLCMIVRYSIISSCSHWC